MDILKKIFIIMGLAFAGIGGLVSFIFFAVGSMGVFTAMPLFFVLLGLAFIGAVLNMSRAAKNIVAKGTKYPAKIYSYVNNTSFMVNGSYTVNIKVRYFDKTGVEREAIIPTSFARGSSEYPIGMTIDIYEYKGKYGFDPHSVRDEILVGENELMDDKPVDPSKMRMIAVKCPNCGSTYEAVKGYTSKCPYCDGYTNA